MSTNGHQKLLAKYTTARPQTQVQSPSVELFHDFMDAVRPVPPIIDEQHYMRLKRVAAFLGLADDEDSEEVCAPEPVVPVVPFKQLTYFTPKIWRKSLDLMFRVRKLIKFYPFVYKFDNYIPTLIKNVNLANNPFVAKFVQKSYVTIAQEIAPNTPPSRASDTAGALHDSQVAQTYEAHNEQHDRTQYSTPSADDTLAGQTMEIIRAAAQHIPDIFANQKDATGTSTAHLVSADLIFGQSNEFAALAANSEFIRRKKLEDAQAATDFRMRRPSILSVSDYFFAGENKGQLITWRKTSNAAGYVIKRINVVTGKEVSFTVFNEELEARYEHVSMFVRAYIVPFYDVQFANVIAFLDESVAPNALYVYKITAFQTFVESHSSAFITPLAQSISLNEQQRQRLLLSLAEDDDSIYPALAAKLLGDRNLDWILAGCNIRASISRRDDRSVTRKYAYLDSKPDFIFVQMNAGKLLVPADPDAIIRTISAGISSFGIVSVLGDVLRDTGILYTFEGLDPAEDGEFSKPVISNDESRLMGIISSAIDGDTMLVNLRTLVTNLTKFIGGGISDQKTTLGLAVSTKARVEVINTSPVDIRSGISLQLEARGRSQLQSELGNLDDIVDLHTFEGISRLIHTIRIVSDLGPERT